MTMSNLIFFIISSFLVLGLIFITLCCFWYGYTKDFINDDLGYWYDYIGGYFLIILLGGLIEMIILFIMGLIFGIDDYSWSFFDVYIRSEVFKLMLYSYMIITVIAIHIINVKQNFLNFWKLKKSYYQLKGLNNAVKKIQDAISTTESEIQKEKDKKHIIQELEKNKKYLEEEYENYQIQIKRLEQYQTKIILSLREQGYKHINYN